MKKSKVKIMKNNKSFENKTNILDSRTIATKPPRLIAQEYFEHKKIEGKIGARFIYVDHALLYYDFQYTDGSWGEPEYVNFAEDIASNFPDARVEAVYYHKGKIAFMHSVH